MAEVSLALGCPSKTLLSAPLITSISLVFSISSGCQSDTWRTETVSSLPEGSAWLVPNFQRQRFGKGEGNTEEW